jgi:hypothetical protein
MSFEVAQLVGGAFGGALASSVLGPWISQRRERRDVRADVLRAVGEVERARWAPVPRDDFRAAIINLRATALVAGVNRDAVESYAQLAQYAQRVSEDSWSVTEDAEAGGGSISGSLGELTRQSATLLADIVWHPYRKRRSVGRDLVKLHADLAALHKNGAGDDGSPWGDGIPWNTALF